MSKGLLYTTLRLPIKTIVPGKKGIARRNGGNGGSKNDELASGISTCKYKEDTGDIFQRFVSKGWLGNSML